MEISLTPTNKELGLSQLTHGRQDQFIELFPDEPKYRWQQIEESLLAGVYGGWDELTNLPKFLREELKLKMPWLSIEPKVTLQSKNRDTYKAAFACEAGEFESVLMSNARGDWTICVSSQIGCGMGCSFCATGKMGFKYNLHSDQIVDQYRYWNFFIKQNPEVGGRISNIVFMGMGEPLANYKNVTKAIRDLLKHTDLGPTKITVSSVGVVPVLKKILSDPEWPPVRIAISLHSADKITRGEIIQTSYENFLEDLKEWSIAYLNTLGNRRHHITFEYVMLNEVNDSLDAAKKLANFVKNIGNSESVKVNLIPYNYTGDVYRCSEEERFVAFMKVLQDAGVNVTRRKTMGDDINAACGQLITLRQEG